MLLASAALAACALIPRKLGPIPTELFPAPEPRDERVLVVVLPGMFSDDEQMAEKGLHRALQESWPWADVLLTSADLAYYREGRLPQRVREEIVEPLRGKYAQVWLAGGSMGGLGALMYEREYPRSVTGLVVLAPHLGDRLLIEQIEDAGGVKSWDPGPLPEELDANLYARQVWQMAKDWQGRPERARHIWLVCGRDDRMLPGSRLLAATLPKGHYLEREGEHDWDFWLAGTTDVFRRLRPAADGKTASLSRKQ